MFTFMIIDDTECENIYFKNFTNAKKYFDTNNHTMTFYVKTIIGWKQIDYKKCSLFYPRRF